MACSVCNDTGIDPFHNPPVTCDRCDAANSKTDVELAAAKRLARRMYGEASRATLDRVEGLKQEHEAFEALAAEVDQLLEQAAAVRARIDVRDRTGADKPNG